MNSKFLLTFALAVLFAVSDACLATTYYVDAARGDDNWTGLASTYLGGSSGPWKSLTRTARIGMRPGDVLALACDGVWHEAMSIHGEGNAAFPVVVHPYGSCAAGMRPEIRPTQSSSAWNSEAGSVYSTSIAGEVSAVWVNGTLLPRARYPAKGLLYADGGLSATTGSSGLVDAALLGTPVATQNLSDVLANIRTVGWKIETVGIASLRGNQLEFSQASQYPVRRGAGYFLEGARWMLDGSPGWYWDKTAGRLYVHLPNSANIDGTAVEYATATPGLRLYGQSYIDIEGLRISRSGGNGINIDGGTNISLRNVQVAQAGQDGIWAKNATSLTIDGCLISQSMRDGIVLLKSDGSQVLSSVVEESGTIDGPRNAFAAINAGLSSNVRIERNRIRSAAYIGIRFGSRAQVTNNVINDVCLVLDDCGAIYTWTNSNNVLPLSAVVKGNVIDNVVGGRDGNPDPYTVAAGIYLDDLTNEVLLEGNTINKAERGIYLHNGFDNTVQHNTIFGSRASGIALMMDHKTFPSSGILANTIMSNVVVSLGGVPFVYYLDRLGRDFIDLFDQNRYLSNNPNSRFIVHRQGLAGNSLTRYSFSDFHTILGKERTGTACNLFKAPMLLVNSDSEMRPFKCPGLTHTACASATDSAGQWISWPVHLSPFSSLVVINN